MAGLVLIVEEEKRIPPAGSLSDMLVERGYEVRTTNPPEAASEVASVVSQVETLWPDIIILDVPSQPSLLEELCGSLDESSLHIGRIIVVDGTTPPPKNEVYLPYPCTSRQLAYRLNKVSKGEKERFLRRGDIVLDTYKRNVRRGDKTRHLTPKKFKLLEMFMENPNRTLSRRELIKGVWQTDYMGDTRTLDVHIRWLREAIEDTPSRPRFIRTVRRVGYRFEIADA